jgi:hypothetical protein
VTRLAALFEGLRTAHAVAILCVVGALVHVQSLFVGYIADDFDLLAAATSPSFSLLRDAFPAGRGTYFRPLVIGTLRLEHALVPSPVLHHIVNLVVHLGSGVLVFLLAERVARRRAVAMGAALVFLAHPIVAYDVNWISGRTDVFGAFFELLALDAFLVGAARGRSRLWGLVAVLALVAGLAAKEVVASTPIAAAALLAFEWSRRRSPGPVPLSFLRLWEVLVALVLVTAVWVSSLYLRFYRSAESGAHATPFSLLKGFIAAPLGLIWPNAYGVTRHYMTAYPSATLAAGCALVVLVALVLVALARRSRNRLALAALFVFASAPLVPLLLAGLTPTTRLMHVPLATIVIAAAAVSVEETSRVRRFLSLAAPFAMVSMILGSLSRGHQWVESSRRLEQMCEDFKTLRRGSPNPRIGFVSTAFEMGEVPLYFFHQHAALGTCLADDGRFDRLDDDLLIVGAVILDHSPKEPIVTAERLSATDIRVHASRGALFGFDIHLDPRTPVVFPELTLLATEVRHEREVSGYVVSLAPSTLQDRDLFFFDGLTLRRVPSPP